MADRRPIVETSQLSEHVNTDGLIFGESMVLVEQASSPATPPSGYGRLYCKTNGNLYYRNDAGTETQLS